MEDIALGVEDIARLCRVSPQTVQRWIDQEGLPYAPTLTEGPRVEPSVLQEFLKAHNIWSPGGLSPKKAMRVLVVDDAPDVRHVMMRLVQRRFPQAVVYEAADGFEAGQKVMSLHPDLVILDIHLPGLDGLKVCRSLRSYSMLKNTVVLAITGDKAPQMKEEILAAGADDVLLKPVYPHDLDVALGLLLPGR